MNIVMTLWSASVYWTVDFVFTTAPVMSGPSIVDIIVFVEASYVLSLTPMPGDMESVQAPTYFFFAASHVVTPRPSNVIPGIRSPLKAVTRQRPPHERVSSCTPVERIEFPSGVVISTTASQVPASLDRIWCSGPGGGGAWANAAPGPAVMINAAAMVHRKHFVMGPPLGL